MPMTPHTGTGQSTVDEATTYRSNPAAMSSGIGTERLVLRSTCTTTSSVVVGDSDVLNDHDGALGVEVEEVPYVQVSVRIDVLGSHDRLKNARDP
jgi:hypothetical protein